MKQMGEQSWKKSKKKREREEGRRRKEEDKNASLSHLRFAYELR
jgi:hypothetical protein